MNAPRSSLVAQWKFILLLPALCAGALAQAQSDPLLRARPDYINWLFDPTPAPLPGTTLAQPASVAHFSGSLGAAGDPATPTDGQIRLLRSVIGQAFGGMPLATNDILPGSPDVVPVFVAVNGSGSVTVSPQTNLYLTGQTLTLTATPRNTNWTRFVAWSDGNTNATRSFVVGLNNSLTAVFTNFVPLETFVLKQWDKVYGGTAIDWPYGLGLAPDGGGFLAGSSDSPVSGNKSATNNGITDAWVVRFDANGNKVWDRDFGGVNFDQATCVLPTADGGALVGAYSESSQYGGYDFWLLRLSASGALLWQQFYGGSGNDYLQVIRATSDGGYLLAGDSSSEESGRKTSPRWGSSDFWVVRIDSGGNVLWDKSFGGINADHLFDLQVTADGGCILGGWTVSDADGNKTSPHVPPTYAEDFWVVRLDAGGSKLWETDIGGDGNDLLYAIQQTPDGGFLLGGASNSGVVGDKTAVNWGDYDIWLVRLTAGGVKLWDRTFGTSAHDEFRSIVPLATGGFALAGTAPAFVDGNKTSLNHGLLDYWLVAVDGEGMKLWERTFGGTNAQDLTVAGSTPDGGIILGGEARPGTGGTKSEPGFGQNDFWVTKIFVTEAPVGTPVVLVNGAYSASNRFDIPATNIPVSVTLTSTFPGGYIYYSLDGVPPVPGEANTFEYSAPGNPGAPLVVSNSVVVLVVAYSSDATGNVEADADPVTINIVPLYNLTDTTPGGGSVVMNPPGGVYLSNAVVSLTATPSNGWSFLRWESAMSNTGNPLALTMDGAKSIRAVFGTGLTTTTNLAGTSVALWPPTGPYPYGSLVRLVGVPSAGNRLNRWFSNISGPTTNTLDFTVLTANTNIAAFFAALTGNNFTLTTLLNGSGTVTRNPAANSYASNTTVTLTAMPDAGYAFADWTGDTSGLQTNLTLVMHTNKSVTASFLNLANFPGIIAQPQSQTVVTGAVVTFSMSATGAGPLYFQWRKNGTNLPNDIITVAGNGTGTYSGDGGVATNASLFNPFGVTVGASNNMFIADYGNHRVRKVDANGIITTLAGNGLIDFSGDGGAATNASLRLPYGVAVDAYGNLFIADTVHSRVRKVDTNGIITTVAGNGTVGLSGDGGAATNASLSNPPAVAVDSSGNIFIADGGNNRVRKVSTNGIITTVAGSGPSDVGSFSGDGGAATNATMYYPSGVAVDSSGNLFIADQNTQRIRRVGTNGIITSVAGSGPSTFNSGSYSGDSGPATNASLNLPSGVAIDAFGNLFIGDQGNHRVRKVDVNGTITSAAGNGANGSSGDGGPGIHAALAQPYGVAVDSSGTVFIADLGAHRIRKLVARGSAFQISAIAPSDGGSYDLVLANAYGSITSSVATLTVISGVTNGPPSVNLTNPIGGAVFVAPNPVIIGATASDSDGTVTQVIFFAGATQLALRTNAPFTFVWTNAPVGSHSLTAVATDNAGLSATSAPVNIAVGPLNHGVLVLPAVDRAVAHVGDTITATIGVRHFDSYLDTLTFTNVQLLVHHAPPVGDVSSGNLLAGPVTLTGYYVPPGNAASLLVVTGSFTVLPADGPFLNADVIADGRDNRDGIGGNSVADSFRLAFPVQVRVSRSALCVTRSCVNGTNGSGVLTFSGSVTNCGNTPLTNVVVSNWTGGVFTWVAGPVALATNQGLVFSGSYSNVPAAGVITDALWAWGTDDTALTVSNFATATCSNVVAGPPQFAWSNAAVNISEGGVTVTLLVTRNFGGFATVNYASGDGSATAGADYNAVSGQLQFQSGEFVKPITVTILEDLVVEGNHTFNVTLSLPATNGVPLPSGLASPSVATVTIVDNDVQTGSSFITIVPPSSVNTNDLGSLRVYLTGDAGLGQWRLPWERTFRASGTAAGGLQPGLYELEFKPVSGYLPPAPVTVAVSAAQERRSTNAYTFFATTPAGSLTVFIDPAEVATNADPNCRGQWRVNGSAFRDSGSTVAGLPAGSYTVEFKGLPVNCGWGTPATREATVRPGLSNSFRASYYTNVAGPSTPSPLNFANDIQNSYANQQPFTFVGQVVTEFGEGSGVVVKERVVLTAAHVVFDDYSLSWVGNARWFFQRHAPDYNPAPQEVRGYFVNGGYAAQRQAEGTPGVSQPASFDLDVAALYFYEPAGRGGYGGYLVSETPSPQWLQTNSLKALVGYPVEGIAPSALGKVHSIGPTSMSFDQTTGAVFTCAQIRGLPGNSGGPLCVKFGGNNYFYPAGVYVGGSDRAIVRAIDSRAVEVINQAELTSNLGTNQTGGGVVRFGVSVPAGTCFEFATVMLGPPSAIPAGAQWRVHYKVTGLSPWTNSPTYRIVLNNKPDFLELADAEGFLTPDASNLTLGCLATNLVFTYFQLLPRLDVLDNRHLIISGVTSRTYRVEYAPRLGATNPWTPLTNISFPANNSVAIFSNALAPVTTNRFFRATRVP